MQKHFGRSILEVEFWAPNCGDCRGGNYKKKGLTFISHKMCPLGIFFRAQQQRGARGTFLFMTFFHWVQQFPNSHLFNDPKTLMYHQEHGDFFLKYSSSSLAPHQPLFWRSPFSYRNHNFSLRLLLCSFFSGYQPFFAVYKCKKLDLSLFKLKDNK